MNINTNKINANKRNSIIIAIALLVAVAGLATGIGLKYSNKSVPQIAEDPSSRPTQVNASVEPIESVKPEIIEDKKVQPEVPEQIESPEPTPIAGTTEPGSSSISIQEGQPKADVQSTEPPKPTPKGDNTDKTQPPTYDEDDVKPGSSEPKMGDRNDKGEIYIAGFGWVKEIGESVGTIADSDGDIDKQVGIMD
ncbi:MAG: hypothetical protein GX236_09160 [Clostridiaceae bacterium]|nr:hypothetical protein [Clostridiaceae bacterium]